MCKITVLETVGVEFIFGLDNMRSHQCSIDLKIHQLIFPDSDIKVNFLSDGEIKKLKLDKDLEREDSRNFEEGQN
jgi:hypothetical protein